MDNWHETPQLLFPAPILQVMQIKGFLFKLRWYWLDKWFLNMGSDIDGADDDLKDRHEDKMTQILELVLLVTK